MSNLSVPRFLICDPAPAESEQYPLNYVLCTEPASLWAFNDHGEGQLKAAFTPLPLDGSILASLAREVGDWYAECRRQEDEMYDDE